jgi:hypothetical protein
MKATIITTEDLRNCDGRDYNPQVWETNINRMTQNYKDVVFYHVPKGDGYDYDRYYVEYTLPEGLRLFSDFGYGGSLTSGGFYRLDKNEVTADGRNPQRPLKSSRKWRPRERSAVTHRVKRNRHLQHQVRQVLRRSDRYHGRHRHKQGSESVDD